MGGQIAVGFRFASGEVLCYETHTNHLPNWLKSKEVLIDKDEAYIRDYISEALSKYQDSFIPVPLAPLGYGLVFYDFKANRLHDRQNYFGPTHFFAIDVYGGNKTDRIRALAATGKLTVCEWDADAQDYGDSRDLPSLEDYLKLEQKIIDESKIYYKQFMSGDEDRQMPAYLIEVSSPLEHIDYEGDDTWLNYMNDLIASRIDLSVEAIILWNKEEKYLVECEG